MLDMETKNLTGAAAIKKMQHIADGADTCMFASGLSDVPFHVCPMKVQRVDDTGGIWFFSGADSEHNRQIRDSSRVQLMFANAAKSEYLTVFGNARITNDPGAIDELWTELATVWFPLGKDDPNLTLIHVRPTISQYWDAETGKLVSFEKIIVTPVPAAEDISG